MRIEPASSRVRFIVVLLFAVFGAGAQSPCVAAPDRFGDGEKKELSERLQKEGDFAQKVAKDNQHLNFSIQVAVLFLALLATTAAAIIAFRGATTPPLGLRVVNFVAAGLATGLSGFVEHQVKFDERTTIWQVKADTLAVLRNEIEFEDPSRAEFMKKWHTVKLWGDSTPLTALNLNAPQGTESSAEARAPAAGTPDDIPQPSPKPDQPHQ